jgi:hypothetical protein
VTSRSRRDLPLLTATVCFLVARPDTASSGGVEDEHPFDVPGHSHEAPLAAHLVEPAERELTESEHRFDDAKHRFRGLFAESIDLPAVKTHPIMTPPLKASNPLRLFDKMKHWRGDFLRET